MTDKHPGIAVLAKLVALLERGAADVAHRRAAVLLAMHLFQLDEISKSKCLEVARAAGSMEPALDDAVRALQDDWSGDVPLVWARSPVPLLLSEARLAEIALLVQEPRGRSSSELSPEVRAARTPGPPHELVDALNHRIHPASGRLLASRPARMPPKKK